MPATECPVAKLKHHVDDLLKASTRENESVLNGAMEGLRDAATYLVATSKEGLLFQLEQLEIYADGVAGALNNDRDQADEIEAAIVDRLAGLIRKGVEGLQVAE